ncbi:sensor histidine kinase [Paraglaciecola sp. 2405UD69-4]|uniref:sensor histidine kinase n=1 Tax=Paraglaciecola sp. 2405UD69-4 TaxID=3391836 RepID=UPI0039C99D3F
MQLGSLRQLTFVSFVVVLVPLAMLVGYSQLTFGKIGKIASDEAEYSVNLVRRVSKMENLSVDIERLVRQYSILEKDALKDLIEKSVTRFIEYKEYICKQVVDQRNCLALDERLAWIADFSSHEDQLLIDAQFAEFRNRQLDLVVQIDAQLDRNIHDQQLYVSSVRQTQFWLTAFLVSVSFLLIVIGISRILKPVTKLEEVIRAIASQDENLPKISKSGPKELISLEHKLHGLASRLSQLENLRHALLRHASHELKTPLASIKEGCSLLTEEVVGGVNEQQKEVLQLLNSSTDRLNLLIVQLLDYNLLLQQSKPVFCEFETQSFFDEFLTDNSLAIQQHDNQINMQLDIEVMYADEKLYRRIVDNLLSNAIAHGSKGRPIDIRLYNDGDMQVLDFSNRGKRIEPEQRNILFQPFSRGEGVRNDRVTGSGLGLSIVSDCAKMMFGKAFMVDVDYSDVCFRVQIPSNKEVSL